MFVFNIIAEEQSNLRAAAKKTDIDDMVMAQIASGDREALATVYYKSQQAVFAFALSILRNRQNAEDVLQDTFISVWDHAGTYRPQGKPMAWILTITRNLSLMKLKERRNRDVPLDEEFYHLAVENPIAGEEDRIILEGAMTALSEEERQIVMLHGLSGLKHREIAEILQLPLSTVLSKYRRALAKLQSILKEED